MTYATTKAAALGLALLTSACLSIDEVNVREQPDAGVDDVDAGPNANAPVCIDRGSYDIDSIRVLGLAEACDRERVCVDGRCVPEPECTEGTTSACKISFSEDDGPRSEVIAIGDDFYWFESGTGRTLQTHRYDGAIVRMTAGVWKREAVVEGLDLFDEERGEFESMWEIGLERSGDWLVGHFGDGASGELIAKIDGSQSRYWRPDRHVLLCLTDDGRAIISRSDPGVTIVYDLASDADLASVDVKPASCFARGDQLVTRDAPTVRVVDLQTATERSYTPVVQLVGFEPEGLIQQDGILLRTASLGTDANLDWRTVRHLTDRVETGFHVHDGMVSWATSYGPNQFNVVLQGSLTDGEPARVIAEMQGTSGVGPRYLAVGKRWLTYSEPYPDGAEPLHFVPFEPAD